MNKKIRVEEGEVASPQKQCNVIGYRNRIYFYDDVTTESIFELRKCLIGAEEFIESEEAEEGEDCLYIFINSSGGDFFAGTAAYSAIKNFPYPVFTVIEGSAASAATFLYCAGEKKYMYRESYILIHQLSSESVGKFCDLVDSTESSKKLMDTMKNIYLANTKIKQKVLEELVKRDMWLNFEEAKAIGLVDDCFDTFDDGTKLLEKPKKDVPVKKAKKK